MKQSTTISFKTDQLLSDELDEVSSILGVSKSELIKKLLVQGLKPLKTELEPLLKLRGEFKKSVELNNGWITQ